MGKPTKQYNIPQTSLFPFLPGAVQHRFAGLAIAALYFFVMLVISLKYHIVGDYGVETDFYWSYVPQAKQILEGTIPIEDFHGPVYPIVLALISLVSKDLFHAGVVLSILAGAVSLFLIFEILKKLFRSDIALMGTAIVAVNTTFVQYSYTAGTDMLFMALVTASAFLLLREHEMRGMNIALSALLAGIAYLTRYNGIFAVVAVPLAILLANPFQIAFKQRLRPAGLFIGVFLLTIATWGIYCLVEKGSFFYNRNYLNIAYEMFAKGRMSWDQYWSVEAQKFTSLTQVIFADPGLFFGTLVRNFFEHLLSDLGKLVGWQLGAFSIVGIVMFIRGKPQPLLMSYFLLSLCFFGVLLLVFYGERFSMYLLPIYAVLALKVLTWQQLAQYRFWKSVQIGAMASFVLVLWSAVNSYQFNSVNIDSGPKEVVSVAEWFDKNIGQAERGRIIVARKPHIAYYLDMKMQLFPYVNTYEDLIAEMRKVNAAYLYFGLMEAGMRPQFQYLLDPRNAPAELKPLTYTRYPPAVLYKVELSQQP